MKGYVSFVTLVITIISSLFVFYFIGINNVYFCGNVVQESLDKSTKGASLLPETELKTEGMDLFKKMLKKNLATNQIELIEQNITLPSGNYTYYKYDGNEENSNEYSCFDKTPSVYYFVFDSGNIEELIKEVLEKIEEIDDEIKNSMFIELTGKDLYGNFKSNSKIISDNNTTIIGFIEMPIDVFGKQFKIHRFSAYQIE